MTLLRMTPALSEATKTRTPGPAAGAGARGGVRIWVVAAVLFLGTLGLFSRSLRCGFVNYDDPIYLTGNLHVQGGLSWDSVRWAFTSQIDFWQPLTWLSHLVDVELFGSRPWGHHLTNVLWHAANAVLVFLLLRRLTGAIGTSAFAAALFAWHPLRVESVTWVTERKDVMAGFFFLLTLWAYVAYAGSRAAGRPARARYGWTLAAYLGALMCKPVVVVLPLLLLLLDLWPLRRLAPPAAPGDSSRATPKRPERRLGALLLEKVPFFALSAAFAILTLLMQQEGGSFTAEIPLAARIANALVSIPRYLGKFLWPFDLTVVYSHPGTWPAATVIAAILAILAITGAAIRWFRPARSEASWLLIGWGWFLIMLLPNIGLVQVGFQAIADRYTYLPMLGPVIGILCTVRAVLSERIPAWAKAAVPAVLLAACAGRTWDQQGTWRDTSTLFTHALAVTRDNYAAHAFFSYTLLSEGRIAEAETHALRSVQINPRFSSGYEVLALVRLGQGRVDDAIAAYQQQLTLAPRSAAAHRELGDLFLQLGRLDEAESHFRAALRIHPDFAVAYAGLAHLELVRRRPAAAVADFEQALRLEPRDWTLHNAFAGLLATLGRTAEARGHFETSLRVSPRNVQTRLAFARFLGDAGLGAEAVEQARQAVALQPDDPAGQAGLAHALEAAGRLAEAYRAFEQAAQRRPDDIDALCGLGRILLERHQPEQAQTRFAAAVKIQPGCSPALTGLALAATQLGRTDDAAANLEAAVRAGPEDATTLVLLGDTRARQGRMADAAGEYEHALQVRPGDASVEARLGFVLYLSHQPAQAARHWEEAMRLDPKTPDLRSRIEQARREAAAADTPP
jgi:protein O-mannosyl-transferase